MPIVDSCWSPFIWSNDLKTGCRAIAFYTTAMCVILITLIFYQINGGASAQLYNPMFETDVRGSTAVVGGFYTVYLILLIISSMLIVYGVKEGVRGWLLPWLILWSIVCVFQLLFGLWLLYAYYIYLDSVFIVICDYLWMSYNIYCWIVVLSMYKIFEKLQSPNIELLWP